MAAGEQVHLTAGVGARYETTNCLPTGPAHDDAVCAALRGGGPLGDPNLDDVFAGFDSRAVITWPESRVRLTMDCSEAFNHLVVFTPRLRADGPPLPWFCVEPCTMPNDGFNLMHTGQTDTGVRVLAPGESLETRVRFRVERL
jgi:aldose 1-epimerase